MRSLLRYSIAPLFLIGPVVLGTIACGSDEPPEENPGDPKCQLDVADETDPTHPDGFDINVFNTTIQPLIISKCTVGACHDSSAIHPNQNMIPEDQLYKIWTDAKADAPPGSAAACNNIQNFNAFIHQTDYANPANSLVLQKASGAVAHGGLIVFKSDAPEYKTILDFLTAAQALRDADAPPTTGPPNGQYFDKEAFASVIQPLLDSSANTCSSGGGCHGAPGSLGNNAFALVANATGADLDANFASVVGKVNLKDTAGSTIYFQATNSHEASPVMSSADAADLLDWIQDAAEAKCNVREGCQDDTPVTGCIPAEQFNALAFENEILPILAGQFDYNDPNNDNPIATGCTRPTCHGDPQFDTEGSMYLGGTPEESLASFGCFVNLTNPAFSQVLLCPLDSGNCIKAPHPGGQIFQNGADDLNYQRIASYIAASSNAPPYDFAFFAEKINPLFLTPNADNQTCADPGLCHGVSAPGEVPPNGSDFPILGGSSVTSLTYNFIQAASFANFFDAANSPLLLYPTDTIGELVPGDIHPPGAVIDINSQEAIDIQTWAQGLRLNDQGFNFNWLVAGEFLSADDVNESPLENLEDASFNPRDFEPSQGVGECQGNPCEWQGFFSDVQDINLNLDDFFPRDVSVDRIAYAIAYVVNISGQDLDNSTILVNTVAPNELKVYVNGVQAGVAVGGVTTATASANFPTITVGDDAIATPVVIKIFQPAGEDGNNFTFNVQFLDDEGDPIEPDDAVILLNSYEEGI